MCNGDWVMNMRRVQVLGGTGYIGDSDLQPKASDRKGIWERCTTMVPSLAQVHLPCRLPLDMRQINVPFSSLQTVRISVLELQSTLTVSYFGSLEST